MGNEIVDEANKFLGKKYVELRGIQFEWKKLLKDHIKSFGINRLVNSLIKSLALEAKLGMDPKAVQTTVPELIQIISRRFKAIHILQKYRCMRLVNQH